MENQELESTLISRGNGKSARKWFISLQTQDRPVAESPLMHECHGGGAGVVRRLGGGGRRWCRGQDQSSKSVKNIEKCGGNTLGELQTCPVVRHMYWCGRQTEGGTMQHVQGASRIWGVRHMHDRTGYLSSQAVSVVFEWHSRTRMPLPTFTRYVESPKVEYNTFVISPRAR